MCFRFPVFAENMYYFESRYWPERLPWICQFVENKTNDLLGMDECTIQLVGDGVKLVHGVYVEKAS